MQIRGSGTKDPPFQSSHLNMLTIVGSVVGRSLGWSGRRAITPDLGLKKKERKAKEKMGTLLQLWVKVMWSTC